MKDVKSTHLVPLPAALGTWSAWRWSALRGAGFPASLVARLGSADAADAADALLAAEASVAAARGRALDAVRAARTSGAGLEDAWRALRKQRVPGPTGTVADAALDALREATATAVAARETMTRALAEHGPRASSVLREVAARPDFREALAWQNRGVLHTAIAPLLRSTGSNASDRRHEELVASYLQRYCTKNDTIGFFGPVGWATLDPGTPTTTARPGPGLLAERSVHFEQWPIDELARVLSSDSRVAPWLAPRRLPFVQGSGTHVTSAMDGPHALADDAARVLALADGDRTAAAIATDLALPLDAVIATARKLADERLVAFAIELPLGWNPDEALRTWLARIDEPGLRDALLAPLDELCRARDRVGAAREVADLEAALADLDATFTGLTGTAATRNAGTMYAARALVFEDCRRDLDVVLGRDVLDAIGPALSLVLTSARWMTREIATAYRARFRALFDELSGGARTLDFASFWFRCQRLFLGKETPVGAVRAELARRWQELLAVEPGVRRMELASATLAPAVAAQFPGTEPGWTRARHHSPDVMIAASDLAALQRGEFEATLGEIHVGMNTLDSAIFVAKHPCPGELVTAYEADAPETALLPVFSKEWRKVTVRTNRAFAAPWQRFLETSFDRAPGPRAATLALASLQLEDVDGELIVRGPDGFELALLEFCGFHLSELVMSELRILPEGEHTPRVTIDRLVVARETWHVLPSAMSFAFEEDATARFLGARRWARELGLPRFVFAKSAVEVKPVYVDLASPHFLRTFARIVRRTKEHPAGETALTITEMLPGLDRTWLPDAEGERYTSEIRFVTVDGGIPDCDNRER